MCRKYFLLGLIIFVAFVQTSFGQEEDLANDYSKVKYEVETLEKIYLGFEQKLDSIKQISSSTPDPEDYRTLIKLEKIRAQNLKDEMMEIVIAIDYFARKIEGKDPENSDDGDRN